MTLDDVIAMDLAQFKEVCVEIIGNSVKELSVERSIRDVEKVMNYLTNCNEKYDNQHVFT